MNKYPFKLSGANINRKLFAVGSPALDITQTASKAVSGVTYNFRGAWSSTLSCVLGDTVLYGTTMWLATAASTGVAPGNGLAQWQSLGSYSAFQGIWSATTNYVMGDEVVYSGNFWLALAANTNSAPTASNANWQIAGPTSLDNVADGTIYTRTLSSVQTGNVPDLSKGILNKNLTYVTDGTTPLVIGTGDGTTTAFSLPAGWQSGAAVYKSDWQGNQLQYSTPRTNYVLESENLALVAYWYQSQLSVGTAVVGPDGSTSDAFLLTVTTSGGNPILLQGISLPQTYYTATIWCKANTISHATIHAWDGTNNRPFAGTCQILSGPGTITTSGGGGTTSPFLIDGLSTTQWTRVGYTAYVPAANANVGLYIQPSNSNYTSNSGDSVYFSKPQVCLGQIYSSYIPNSTTSPVTVTDYTLSSTQITFAAAPANTAALTAQVGRSAVANGPGLMGVLGVDPYSRPYIDFSQTGHLSKILDNINDGTTYGRMKSTSLTGNDFDFAKGGVNKILDNIGDGASFVRLLGSHASGNVAYNYKGVWNSATAYVIGDETVYGTSYWLALAASTNSAPATGNANWQVVGTYSGFQGAWSSAATYPPGAEVTYAGNFWISLVSNTNSAPTTSNANWQIAGPTSLDDVADGSTYTRTLGSVQTGNVPDLGKGILGKNLGNIGDDLSGSGRAAPAVGTLANRPTAGTAGKLYLATNAGTQGIVYRDTGTAWVAAGVGHLADINGTTDNLVAGTTTDVVNQTNLTAGNVDLGKAGVNGRILDNMADTANYAKIKAGEITGNEWNPANAGNANAQTQYKSAVTGSQSNYIPDSDLRFGYNYYPPSLDFSSGKWQIAPSPSGNANAMTLVPGTYPSSYRYSLWFYLPAGTYTLSVTGASSSAISAGYVFAAIYSYTIGTGLTANLAQINFGVGNNPDGRFSATFTVATAGYFVYLVDTSGVTNSSNMYLIQPQLESGSVMTGYRVSADTAGYALYQGSVPPTVPAGGFTYTSTTTTIDWSWSAFTVSRTDATTFTVPTGTQNYSGLTASHTYYFYPYWNLPNSGLAWGGPFTSPTAAEMAAIQVAFAIPLCNTGVPASTTASGSGGGSGGGNHCFRDDNNIVTASDIILIGNLRPDADVHTPSGPRRVRGVSLVPQSDWIHIITSDDEEVVVTPSHVLRRADGSVVHAQELRLGEILEAEGGLLSVIALRAEVKEAYAVRLKVDGDWLYLKPNGLVHHNQNQKP